MQRGGGRLVFFGEEAGYAGEDLEAAGEDVVESRDGHAVVGDGDVLFFGLEQAVLHFLGRKHAAAAVDYDLVGSEVFGIFAAAGEMEVGLDLEFFPDPLGDLYGADVLALPVVRAAFRDEDGITVFQGEKGLDAFDLLLEVALGAGKQDGKGSEGNGFRDDLHYFAEGLAVGDHERRSYLGEGLGELGVSRDERKRAFF